MLIRTQNRKGISNLNNLDYIGIEERFDHGKRYIYLIAYNGSEESSVNLAEYSSMEKAIKVLDMIQEEFLRHKYIEGGSLALQDYYAPPFGFIPPKVFNMPQEEEVVP